MIEFSVVGVPRPAGSKKAFVNPKTGRANLADVSGEKGTAWRSDVRSEAMAAYQGPPLSGPVTLLVVFFMPRPQRHYRTGKLAHLLRDDAPTFHTSAPDATKLLRGLEDSLKSIAWIDDSQVAHQCVWKVYGEAPGARVLITKATPVDYNGNWGEE